MPDVTVPQCEGYPALSALTAAVLSARPQHRKYIEASFDGIPPEVMERMEEVASFAGELIGDDLEQFAADYHWVCDKLREEQFHFARQKKYRLSALADAVREVYGNDAYMSRYVQGLLVSQVFWRNHAQAMDIYRTRFLPGNRDRYAHLEIGPGHGLFLVFAAQDSRCGSVAGWDLSPASLAGTRAALKKMHVHRPVALEDIDIVSATPTPDFDSIVCSEVLEHTETPQKALDNIFSALRPGGRLFLNIPVNSPAPDHIYLWREPEDIRAMIVAHGYEIEQFWALPPTGKTIEQARKFSLDISCVAIARKPDVS